MSMKKTFGSLTAAGLALTLAGPASGNIVINELLGSTTSIDDEFIELYNAGPSAVDISGWTIELWESDAGGSFGDSDGASPITIDPLTTLNPGDYYLLANPEFLTNYSAVPDQAIPANAIENSSYTILLKDAASATINSIFMTDGGSGDAANDAGTLITPDFTFGPDGTFVPAGFYRVGDGSNELAALEFTPQPAPSATPGAANIPEPASLALVGLGGLVMLGRRRSA
jgi:hypothetical protein